MTELTQKTEAEALAGILKNNFEPRLIDIGKTPSGDAIQALQAPAGVEFKSVKALLDQYRDRPLRRKGDHHVTSLDSFIAIGNRFKDDDSAIFANPDRTDPSLTAIFNFHQHGGDLDSPSDNLARFGDHRAVYKMKLSKEWQAWQEFDGKALSQIEFAVFLENRIADILPPDPDLLGAIDEATAGGDFGEKTPKEQLAALARLLGGEFATPNRLLELSRGLAVRDNLAVKQVTNLQTGEGQIQWQSEHTDETGVPLKIPNLFLLGIPIFENSGTLYRICVRLRYRVAQQAVKWIYQMYRVEQMFDHAITEAAKRATDETGMPLYLGSAGNARD